MFCELLNGFRDIKVTVDKTKKYCIIEIKDEVYNNFARFFMTVMVEHSPKMMNYKYDHVREFPARMENTTTHFLHLHLTVFDEILVSINDKKNWSGLLPCK